MPRKSVVGSSYPPDWPEIARRVKDEAGWRCVRCAHPNDLEAGYLLTVHHLDMNPSNSAWWNMAALCQKCHLHIQAKVVMERTWMLPHSEWFKPYVAGYYAFHCGLPDDRESVLSKMDELIALGRGRLPLEAFRDE